MKYIGFFILLIAQIVLAADAELPASAPASKAEFVYPDFSQCYDKNKHSIVYFGTTRAVAISEKQAVAYSKEKPSVPYVRYDYLSHLYLFDSPKPLMPIKLKPTSELKVGEWLESLTDNSLIVVNASKIGQTTGELFEFAGKGEINSIVGGLCCEMYGLGIGEQFFIASEELERFINGKSMAYPEFGARFAENNESVVVDFVDPNFKAAKIKAGDTITELNGQKITTLAQLNDILKSLKDTSKISAKIKRDGAWIEENIRVPKPEPKKVPLPKKKVPLPTPKKESYLHTKGFTFNNDLQIIDIKHGSFAEQSGLKIGDRLMQINGQPVGKVVEADAYLNNKHDVETNLLFDRDDFQFFVTLKR